MKYTMENYDSENGYINANARVVSYLTSQMIAVAAHAATIKTAGTAKKRFQLNIKNQ